MTAKRQTLTPNRDSGWNREHTVEIELVDRHSATKHSLYAVYLNGDIVGWVSGYAKYGRSGAGWAFTVGKDRAHFGFHAGESRRAMVEMIVEHALRDAAR
jgi:hypothetical protein